MPSGSSRGIAATQVLKRSIFGFLSPLEFEDKIEASQKIMKIRKKNTKNGEECEQKLASNIDLLSTAWCCPHIFIKYLSPQSFIQANE